MTTESNMTPSPSDTAALVERLKYRLEWAARHEGWSEINVNELGRIIAALSALAETKARLAASAKEAEIMGKVYCANTMDCGAWREHDKRCGHCWQDLGDEIADRIRSRASPPAAGAERGETT